MINFPVLKTLAVDGYQLYPGRDDIGLDVDFEPGLTMVLGANGLGKTTLVSLLYRMCAGPYDIKGLQRTGELGGRRLDATKISRVQERYFASRVSDSAGVAVARLTFDLGNAEIAVERSLARLKLVSLQVDGADLDVTENDFHSVILRHSGLSSFGDWILLLRH